MTRACDTCLERARLIEAVAPRIELLADRAERPAGQLLARSDEELIEIVGLTPAQGRAVRERVRAAARADATRAGDGGTVCRHGDHYPAALRQLDDAPRALFHTGPVERLVRRCAEPAVAIVGARRASEHGKQAAFELGRGLAAAGVTVVSGMAFGIDAACHLGALERGGPAIAVLASGADRPSPAGNRHIYRELREHGTVLSEMPWGAKPARWLFPARNRIMAGLAEMTVVVEAAQRSGSLITADFALDLGRKLAAMPGAPGAERTAGNNALLREGCSIVRGTADVLDDLVLGSEVAERTAEAARQSIADEPQLLALLDAVEVGESLALMAERSGFDARQLRGALARLEQEGLIRRAGLGGYVATMVG